MTSFARRVVHSHKTEQSFKTPLSLSLSLTLDALKSMLASETPRATVIGQPSAARAQQNQSMVSSSSATANRTTIKVRNVRESIVYHLIFDGDIGRLTGQQLRAHVETVSGIPAGQQLMSFNGQPFGPNAVGFTVGLQDGCTVLLDVMQRAEEAAQRVASTNADLSRQSTGGAVAAAPAGTGQAVHFPSPPRRASPPQPSISYSSVPTGSVPQAAASPSRMNNNVSVHRISRLDAEIDDIRKQEADMRRAQTDYRVATTGRYFPGEGHSLVQSPAVSRALSRSSAGHGLTHGGQHAAYQQERSAYAHEVGSLRHEEADVDVEVTIEPSREWLPVNSQDVEVSRQQHQDYVWKMEQVRFETERMSREREMRRQQQELEYHASVLDRERAELERRTQLERLKFDALRRVTQEQLAIQSRMTPSSAQY